MLQNLKRKYIANNDNKWGVRWVCRAARIRGGGGVREGMPGFPCFDFEDGELEFSLKMERRRKFRILGGGGKGEEGKEEEEVVEVEEDEERNKE